MRRVQNIDKKSSAPRKILHMSLPDEETLAFWKATADDPQEYADRITRFSRALGNNAKRNAFRSPERRRRNAVRAVQSRRSKPLGKLLTMPSHPNEIPDQDKERL